MAQQRILQQALPAMKELDRMIFQMETTLGKPHSVSPFSTMYPKSEIPKEEVKAAPKEEEKKPAEDGGKKAQKK